MPGGFNGRLFDFSGNRIYQRIDFQIRFFDFYRLTHGRLWWHVFPTLLSFYQHTFIQFDIFGEILRKRNFRRSTFHLPYRIEINERPILNRTLKFRIQPQRILTRQDISQANRIFLTPSLRINGMNILSTYHHSYQPTPPHNLLSTMRKSRDITFSASSFSIK